MKMLWREWGVHLESSGQVVRVLPSARKLCFVGMQVGEFGICGYLNAIHLIPQSHAAAAYLQAASTLDALRALSKKGDAVSLGRAAALASSIGHASAEQLQLRANRALEAEGRTGGTWKNLASVVTWLGTRARAQE